jgi:hypothetical protein
MKKTKILAGLLAMTMIFWGCQKEGVSPLNEPKASEPKAETFEAGPDNCFPPSEGIGTEAALRQITFGVVLPSSVFYNFTLAEVSDVVIFAQDCCIQDDVVELYVDGCLVATIDSRGSTTAYSETHTVTLPAGNHVIEYRNTISSISVSGWNVSETFVTASNIMIDGCNTGVPNLDLTCGNSMQEAILACANGAANHGAFVSCVAHLTNTWKKAGLITGAQKDAIMECAAESDLPAPL